MALKEFWSQTGRWMRSHNPLVPVAHRPEIGEDGLISHTEDASEQAVDGSMQPEDPGNEITVRAVPQIDRTESIEKLQQGFDKLVGCLSTADIAGIYFDSEPIIDSDLHSHHLQ